MPKQSKLSMQIQSYIGGRRLDRHIRCQRLPAEAVGALGNIRRQSNNSKLLHVSRCVSMQSMSVELIGVSERSYICRYQTIEWKQSMPAEASRSRLMHSISAELVGANFRSHICLYQMMAVEAVNAS